MSIIKGTSAGALGCPGWRGDLAAYLVGALDLEAAVVVRRHLGACPACRAEYEELVPVAAWLALLTPHDSADDSAACGDRE